MQKKQKVHEKTTYTYRINARTKAMIRPAGDTDDDLSDEEDKEKDGTMVLKDDPGFVLSTTKGKHSLIVFSYFFLSNFSLFLVCLCFFWIRLGVYNLFLQIGMLRKNILMTILRRSVKCF